MAVFQLFGIFVIRIDKLSISVVAAAMTVDDKKEYNPKIYSLQSSMCNSQQVACEKIFKWLQVMQNKLGSNWRLAL